MMFNFAFTVPIGFLRNGVHHFGALYEVALQKSVGQLDALSALSAITLVALNLVGTAVFAISGALAAAKLRQNLVTFAFFAAVTGLGGGTLRDVLIGAPVFWMQSSQLLAICLTSALLVWITPHRMWSDRAIDWFDGFGLAAFAAFGSAKTLAYGLPWLPAAVMGVVTACMGGIIRDMLANVPSVVLRRELYVTPAALTSGLYVALAALHVAPLFSGVVAVLSGFGLRGLALWNGWALPLYRGLGSDPSET